MALDTSLLSNTASLLRGTQQEKAQEQQNANDVRMNREKMQNENMQNVGNAAASGVKTGMEQAQENKRTFVPIDDNLLNGLKEHFPKTYSILAPQKGGKVAHDVYSGYLAVDKEMDKQKAKAENDKSMEEIKNQNKMELEGLKRKYEHITIGGKAFAPDGEDETGAIKYKEVAENKSVDEANLKRAEGKSKGLSEKDYATQARQMGEAIDPNRSRYGNMGTNQKRVDSSERMTVLLDQFQNNPDKRQTEALAIAFQNLLSNSNSGAQKLIEGLIPKTARGTANTVMEWLTNNPRGLEQQEFSKRLRQEVDREAGVARKQVRTAQLQELGRFKALKDGKPDLYKSNLDSYKITDQEIEEFNNPKKADHSNDMIQIKASDGSLHRIPKSKLDIARQRDPKLQVVE